MRLWPSSKQWQGWTLPNNLTFVGTYLTAISFIIMVLMYFWGNDNFTSTPNPSYQLKQILKYVDDFESDSILTIIQKTKDDESNKDVYCLTRAIYSIMQPVASTDDVINCIEKIDKDSKFYRYSIFLAWDYLQANSNCEYAPSRVFIEFANSMKERGDKSPFVDLTYYIQSTIIKTNYGIGDVRRFPFHDNAEYKLCLQSPHYYVEAYKSIRNKFENENFKIKYTGAESLNTGLNKQIEIEAIYLHLYKLIGSLHGSSALSFYLGGDEINAKKEMKEFLKYFPNGITEDEKKAFNVIYNSVYLYLLDSMFKQYNISYK
jgi:hypothetical protein